jgi:hypothetical protein
MRRRSIGGLGLGTARERAFDPLLALAGAIGIVAALHLLRPDVHPARHYVSEYGNEGWSWLLIAALLLVVLGLLSLATLARDTLGARIAPRLMNASAALLVPAAVFSTDRRGGEAVTESLAGRVHGVAAIGAFCLLVLAMAALSPRFEGDAKRLGRPSTLALPLALTGVGVAMVAFVLVPEAHGLRQRAFLAIVFGWLVLTASRLRHSDARPLV